MIQVFRIEQIGEINEDWPSILAHKEQNEGCIYIQEDERFVVIFDNKGDIIGAPTFPHANNQKLSLLRRKPCFNSVYDYQRGLKNQDCFDFCEFAENCKYAATREMVFGGGK